MTTSTRTVRGWLLMMVMAAAAGTARADTYPRQPGVDAIHYVFRLTLGDASNEMLGEASVTLKFATTGVTRVFLDLASPASGKGMTVSSVSMASAPLRFSHAENRLQIDLASAPAEGQEVTVTVKYSGIPAGG